MKTRNDLLNELKTKIIETLKDVNWCSLYPNIATPRLGQWKIYKHLKDSIYGIE